MARLIRRLGGVNVSIEIQTEVWRYSRSKGSQRLLLIAIADNCNTESRTAWPTTAYLAGKTLLTQRSIHRLSSELEELGELEVHRNRGRNRSNLYRIRRYNMVQDDIKEDPENVTTCHILDDPLYVEDEFVPTDISDTSDEFVPELKCDIHDIKCENDDIKCEIHDIKCEISPTSNHQEPSRTIKRTIRERDLTIPDSLPEWYEILTNLDHWGGWSLEHCREWLNKNQLTERRALREASGLRTWLDDQKDQFELYEQAVADNKAWKGPTPKPRNKDPWRRFMSFMLEDEKNGGRLPQNNIPPTIATTDGVDKFEIARQEQIARKQEG